MYCKGFQREEQKTMFAVKELQLCNSCPLIPQKIVTSEIDRIFKKEMQDLCSTKYCSFILNQNVPSILKHQCKKELTNEDVLKDSKEQKA